MIMLDNHNLRDILDKKMKLCSGLNGADCYRPRRPKGALCKECHKIYMRGYMRNKRAGLGKRSGVIDGYDFNQDGGNV